MNVILEIRNNKRFNRANMIDKRLLLAAFVFCFLVLLPRKGLAQQEFVNGFYMYNPLAYNPAVTGVNDQLIISGIARDQWTGLNGAPSTQYFNFHTPVYAWFDRFDRIGRIDYPTGMSAGFMIANDVLGATHFNRVSVPVATRVRLTQSGIRLSMGIRADVNRFTIDIDDLRQYDTESYLTEPTYFVDFATGIYAYHTNWYVGFSMTNIRGYELMDYGYKFERHYYGMAGYAYILNDDIVLRATTLATIVTGTPFSITVTPAVIIKNNIETGISYRYDDMIGAFIAINILRNLEVGYWYEYGLGVKSNEVGATHEVMFQFKFDRFKKKVVSPRYFW